MQYFQNLQHQIGDIITKLVGIELVYSLIIILLCFWIYYKMKEAYSLTGHKGIGLLRNTFLFFGLAFASRLMIALLTLGIIKFSLYFPKRIIPSLLIISLGYFSTMAIFSLTMSSLWHKVESKFREYYLHIIALFIAILAFITKSLIILVSSQLLLMIVAIFTSYFTLKKSKGIQSLIFIYSSLFIFWFLSLVVMTPSLLNLIKLKSIIYLLAIGIFSYIAYRINKWTK